MSDPQQPLPPEDHSSPSEEHEAQGGSDQYHIVININLGGFGGLGATLVSLVRNCAAPEELVLHFMFSRVGEEHKDRLRRLITQLEFPGEYHIIDYDADKLFGDLPQMFGDRTFYGKLLIAQFVAAPKALYLDTDILVTCDVRDICRIDLGDHLLGGAGVGTLQYTLDRHYFLERGCSPEMPYFNGGVLLLNLDKWRRENVDARWKAIVADDPAALRTQDQTILNYLCLGDFLQLPPRYNTLFPGHAPVEDQTDSILHYVGAPKPWDFGGPLVHHGYKTWKQYNPDFWKRAYQSFSLHKMERAWNIRRSLLRMLLRKVRG